MMWNKNKHTGEPVWRPAEEGGEPPAPEADAVEAMRAWTDSGRELAEIVAEVPTYDANPDTAHYLRSRSREASVAEIDAEYARRRAAIDTEDRHRRAGAAREIRAVSEAETDADEATADLAMIRDYERESSPITAARSLAASARRWRGYDLGYSLVGSALSAVGITATLHAADIGLPVWGYAGLAVAAETVLTVRVVDLIGRLARMEEQDRSEAPAPPETAKADEDREETEAEGSKNAEQPAAAGPRRESTRTHLMVQAGVLLGVSVAVNAAGALLVGAGLLGVLGMCGAVLAALAGLGSHASSRAAARVVTANLATWRGPNWRARRGELRTRASGAYIPALGQEHGAAPATEDGAPDPGEPAGEPVVPDEPERLERSTRAARIDWALADQDVADARFAELTRHLDDPEDGGDSGGGGGLGAPEPTGPAAGPAAARGGGAPPGAPRSTPADQDGPAAAAPAEGGAPAPGGGTPAGQQEQDDAVANRARVLEAVRNHGVGVNNSELHRELGLSRTVVRKHRNALRDQGYVVYAPKEQNA